MRARHTKRTVRGRARGVAPALVLVLAAGLAAACADAPTAPRSAPAFAASASDTTVTTFVVNPTTSNTFVVGGVHQVRLAANSICNPATSGYGPSLWDASCSAATQSITITAKAWTTADGHPMVTFSPDLRFVPGKVNTIYLNDKSVASLGVGTVVWCPTGSSTCVNEAANDPSVATQYDANNGKVYRRIKHFSGYTVVAE